MGVNSKVMEVLKLSDEDFQEAIKHVIKFPFVSLYILFCDCFCSQRNSNSTCVSVNDYKKDLTFMWLESQRTVLKIKE
jgi:hypothetical protein